MAKRFLVLIALLMLGFYIAGCQNSTGPPTKAANPINLQTPQQTIVAGAPTIIPTPNLMVAGNMAAIVFKSAEPVKAGAINALDIYLVRTQLIAENGSIPEELITSPAVLWAQNANRFIPFKEVSSSRVLNVVCLQSGRLVSNDNLPTTETVGVVILPIHSNAMVLTTATYHSGMMTYIPTNMGTKGFFTV